MNSILAPKPLLPAVPSYIESCIPYPPGKPIEEVERELGLKNPVKLASNENPIGTSPKAIAAVQAGMRDLRLYPDAAHFSLRYKLSANLGVHMDEIIVGNGSNEIIDFLVRTYCKTGDNVVSCGAAFIAYRVCAQVHGVEYREPALNKSLVAELQEIETLCDKNTRIVFLPNPNNPTGTYLNRTLLRSIMERLQNRKILVVLDYAYWEYVRADDLPDAMEFYRAYPNIIVTRTFSKIYGLAGLRVGYGIAHPDLLAPMRKVKMPFNVNSLALLAAQAALDDIEHVRRSYETNVRGMEFLSKEFNRMGLEFWPSQANFLLVKFSVLVKDLFEALLKDGMILRPVGGYGLKEHLRISIGTDEENKKLISCLEKQLK